MRGTNRTLVNPPVSSREAFAALDADKVKTEPSPAGGNVILHDITHNGEAFSAVPYDHPDHGWIVSITFPGSALPLWGTTGGVHAFARHLNQLANVADQRNAERLQAALEQDCDRREELRRLGYDTGK